MCADPPVGLCLHHPLTKLHSVCGIQALESITVQCGFILGPQSCALNKPRILTPSLNSYFDEGADEVAFLNITGFRDCPLQDLPMLGVRYIGAHDTLTLTDRGLRV